MMPSTCIINDYRSNWKVYLVFNREDFATVMKSWMKKDRLLVDLSTNEVFRDRTAWCDLTPFHFRILLMESFRYTDKLRANDRVNEAHPAVRSLHFLITALIHCLELRGSMEIDLMHIDRISDTQITYRFSSTLWDDDYTLPKANAEPDLKIIVSNE
jgi:hypothetical protein